MTDRCRMAFINSTSRATFIPPSVANLSVGGGELLNAVQSNTDLDRLGYASKARPFPLSLQGLRRERAVFVTQPH